MLIVIPIRVKFNYLMTYSLITSFYYCLSIVFARNETGYEHSQMDPHSSIVIVNLMNKLHVHFFKKRITYISSKTKRLVSLLLFDRLIKCFLLCSIPVHFRLLSTSTVFDQAAKASPKFADEVLDCLCSCD